MSSSEECCLCGSDSVAYSKYVSADKCKIYIFSYCAHHKHHIIQHKTEITKEDYLARLAMQHL